MPNFFILGSLKCGTTSLHRLLSQHPEIFMSEVKEPHFFDRQDRFEKGIEIYIQDYFGGAQEFTLRGEATPIYFDSPEFVGTRLKAIYGEDAPRFIVLLRDPVARAYSLYCHRRRLGVELPESFEKALAEDFSNSDTTLNDEGQLSPSFVGGGRYASILERWFKLFPRQNFKIAFLEDLIESEQQTVSEILDFLGASPHLDLGALPKENLGSKPRFLFLNQRFRWLQRSRSPVARSIRGAIKSSIPRSIRSELRNLKKSLVRMNNRVGGAPDKIDPVVEAKLRNEFRPEIERLQCLLERDLSLWLDPDRPA